MHGTQTVSAKAPAPDRPLDREDLVKWFSPSGRRGIAGIEVAYGLVRAGTCRAVRYDEACGGRDLVLSLLADMGGRPVRERTSIVGVALPDGSTLTLRPGGIIEYAAAPAGSIEEVLRQGRERLIGVARVAETKRITVLTGGWLPFDNPAQADRTPAPRTELMHRHFLGLGEAGAAGTSALARSFSTQVSLGSADQSEYLTILRTLSAVSPFIAALLVNTPPLSGSTRPVSSQRMLFWRHADPARCQELTARLHTVEGFTDLVSALARLPMIYRRAGQTYVSGPGYSFQECLERGFEDGSRPTLADWQVHLSQVFPAVRPRRSLQTLLADGQAFEHFEVLPAFFLGLIADPQARGRALELVGGLTFAQLDAITVAAARRGFASLPLPVRLRAKHLVELACDGLRRRAPGLLPAMEPVREIAATERTPADLMLRRWQGSWRHSPEKYAAAMAVPTG